MAISPLTIAFASPALELVLDNKIYRAATGSQIWLSSDKGQNWRLIGNFGDTCQIEMLAISESGVIQVKLRQDLHAFWLHLKADRFWLTATYRPASQA